MGMPWSNWLDRFTSIDEKLDNTVNKLNKILEAILGISFDPRITILERREPVPQSLANATIQDILEALTVQRFGEFQIIQTNTGSLAAGASGNATFNTIPTDHYFLVRYLSFNGVVNVWAVNIQGIDYCHRQGITITTDLMNKSLAIQPFGIAKADSYIAATNNDTVARTLYVNLIGTMMDKGEYTKYNKLINRLYLTR